MVGASRLEHMCRGRDVRHRGASTRMQAQACTSLVTYIHIYIHANKHKHTPTLVGLGSSGLGSHGPPLLNPSKSTEGYRSLADDD
jgi:hypothetical protein